MRNTIQLLVGTAVLCTIFGCGPRKYYPWHARKLMSPSGRPGIYIYCTTHNNCFKGAAAKCPSGYQIIDRVGEAYVYMTKNRVRTWYDYKMFVECRGGVSVDDIMGVEAYQNNDNPRQPQSDLQCHKSEWCKQLGRCRYDRGKCVR